MSWGVALPALVGAGAALLTSAGERMIGRFFDKTAKRDAQRDADLAVLESVTLEIRDLATRYWTEEPELPRDQLTEAAIVGRLTFVSEVAEELFKPDTRLLREVQVLTNRFDTSCTSGDFGGAKRSTQPEKCRDIEIAAYRLIHCAKAQRRQL